MHSESNSCPETALLPRFSHIYVEEHLLGRAETEQIRRHYPKAQLIPIRHYKDVFNRRQQNVQLQHRSQKLILAEKHGTLIYPSSRRSTERSSIPGRRSARALGISTFTTPPAS